MSKQWVLRRLAIGCLVTAWMVGGAYAQVESSTAKQPEERAAAPQAKKAERPVNVFKGRVLSETTREPKAGVIVAMAIVDEGRIIWGGGDAVFVNAPNEKVLLFFTKPNGKGGGQTETDAEGRFSIRGLKHATYNLAAIHPEKGLTLIGAVEFTEDSEPLEVLLEALPEEPPRIDFQGRVLDQEGGPVSGATVAITDAEQGHLFWHGGDDIFAYAAQSGEDGPTWFMRVSDAGRSGQTETDHQGEFSIPRIRYGSYDLLVVHSEKGAAIVEDLAFEEDAEPREVVLGEPAFVEGSIKGLKLPSGFLGWSPCMLQAEGLPSNMNVSLPIKLDREHRFRVGPLPQTKKWMLEASKSVKAQGYSATLLRAPVQVRPGETAKLEVDLTKGLQLAGQVRGPQGKPLSGVSVLAKAADDSGWAFGVVTGKDGSYTIKGLPEGGYTLEAKRHARRTGPG